MDLAEVRWLQSWKIVCNDHTLIYSGHNKDHKHGVCLLLSKMVSKSVLGYCALSDRILLVMIHGKPFNLSIIQLYACMSASSEEEIEDFYSDQEDAYKNCGNQDIVIVMGDLNAKVGGEQDPLQDNVGKHGLGERNDRGDLWVDWCATHEQVIMNTRDDSLEADLACLNIDIECDDVNVVLAQYDTSLSRLLDKHAPLKKICIVDRPLSDWMTDDIRALKIIRRKNEVIWRKNPLCINFEIFQESCMAVKHAIDENKTQVIQKKITESNGDQKKLFNIVNTLLGRRKQLVLPDYNNPITLASTFNMFFIDKIANIRAEFPLLESSLPPYSFESMDSIMPYCTVLLESFTMITSEELITCLSDHFPSKLLMSHLPTIIDTITHIINLSISTSVFPSSCKSAIVLPLIKKSGLDPQVLKNYRPVSNLSFLSKVIEKVISSRILTHIADNIPVCI